MEDRAKQVSDAEHLEKAHYQAARTFGQFMFISVFLAVGGLYNLCVSVPLLDRGAGAYVVGTIIGIVVMFGVGCWMWSRRKYHLREMESAVQQLARLRDEPVTGP